MNKDNMLYMTSHSLGINYAALSIDMTSLDVTYPAQSIPWASSTYQGTRKELDAQRTVAAWEWGRQRHTSE